MNCFSSLVSLKDCSILIGSNTCKPCSVRTLAKMTYSQFLKQILFISLDQEVKMIMSFDLPCNLCHVNAGLMSTRKSVILHLKEFFITDFCSFFMIVTTSCFSGSILNVLFLKSSTISKCAMFAF